MKHLPIPAYCMPLDVVADLRALEAVVVAEDHLSETARRMSIHPSTRHLFKR